MDKVKLDIVGLSYSQTQSGAYALVLSEANGERRLPIIISAFEAQAIALELESMTPARPLTHDLFKNFALAFNIQVIEVMIDVLKEGVFHAKLICQRESDGKIIEIDSRTSDAIAIAVRFKCEIFTTEKILKTAGIKLEQEDSMEDSFMEESQKSEYVPENKDLLSDLSIKELEIQLERAVENEDYELASKIRDEINKRTS